MRIQQGASGVGGGDTFHTLGAVSLIALLGCVRNKQHGTPQGCLYFPPSPGSVQPGLKKAPFPAMQDDEGVGDGATAHLPAMTLWAREQRLPSLRLARNRKSPNKVHVRRARERWPGAAFWLSWHPSAECPCQHCKGRKRGGEGPGHSGGGRLTNEWGEQRRPSGLWGWWESQCPPS